MDEDSTNRKKKGGRSLIFRKVFRKTSSSDSGKVLASDDNLVYCDVTKNHVEPEIKKSTSTRGRMSRIFKGVLFDAAMKKKLHRKKSTKISNDSVDSSSPERDENIDNSLNDDNLNVEEVLEADNSPNDSSNVISLTSKDVSSGTQEPSSEVSSLNTSSQIFTEHKATSRVNSMEKKPPLPNPQPSVKPIPTKVTKSDTFNNTTFRLFLFILIGIFVLVVLWMSYSAIATKSSNIEPDQHENVVIIADEL